MVLTILVHLTTLLALVSAGGRTLSPSDSRQFLDLFRRYCGTGSSGRAQDGNTFYYCKFADNGPMTKTINHDREINAGDTPKQVIFVQPPAYNYIHNVALRGSPGNPQQTDIFVLPPTAEHSVQLTDARKRGQVQKPSLYFLSGDGPTSSSSLPNPPPSPERRPSPHGQDPVRINPPQPNPSTPLAVVGGYPDGIRGEYLPPAHLRIDPRIQRSAPSHFYKPYSTL